MTEKTQSKIALDRLVKAQGEYREIHDALEAMGEAASTERDILGKRYIEAGERVEQLEADLRTAHRTDGIA